MNTFLLTLLFILSVLTATTIQADLYWSSTGNNGDWLTLSNWFNLNSGVLVPSLSLPLAGDNIFITTDGTYNVTFSLTTLLTFGSLTIGSATNTGTQTLVITSTYTLGAACTIQKSGGIILQSTLQGSANVNVQAGGSVTLNQGSISISSANSFTVSGSLLATASSNIMGTTVQFLGTTSQIAVSAGASINLATNAVLKMSGTTTMSLQGDLIMSSGSSISVDASASVTQSGSGKVRDGSTSGQILNYGNYQVSTSASATSYITTTFMNQGTLMTSGSGTVILSGAFTQNSNSSYIVVNSNLNSTTGLFTIANGTFKGSGYIGASLKVSGVINVGNSPGRSVIYGDLTCDTSCVLQIEIAGTGSSNYDQIVATGNINIQGWVNFVCINPYSATYDDSFTFLFYNSINYNPILSYITGNGFLFKVPSITVGTISTSMRIARISSATTFGLGFGILSFIMLVFLF